MSDDITFKFAFKQYLKKKHDELNTFIDSSINKGITESDIMVVVDNKLSPRSRKKSCKDYRNPLLPPLSKGQPVHIGIDSEWVFNPENNCNEILSYQFCLRFSDKTLSGIIYTDGPECSDRLSLVRFLSQIIQNAINQGVMTEWPVKIYLYAHFLRADFASFSDCWEFKKKVAGVKGTIGSFENEYSIDFDEIGSRRVGEFELGLRDRKNKKVRHSIISFIDTLLLTPGGTGLSEVGELIGLPKLEIPDGYDIARMDQLLVDNKPAFEAYAIRDAEITVNYGLEFRCFSYDDLRLEEMPLTIGSAAVSLFRQTVTTAGFSIKDLFGITVRKSSRWSRKKGKPHTSKQNVPINSRKDYEANASDAYFGGRNETFYSGPTDVGVWNDFDLAGAYTSAMLGIHQLDFDAAFHSTNPTDYVGHVCGILRVKFKFPGTTRFPSLPVHSDYYGLYYPLEGISVCTASEIEVALNLHCEVVIEWGVVVPWLDEGFRLFEDFVRCVNTHRQLYKKDSLQEKLWKEIGNSTYGKLGQGVKEKNGFDTVTGLHKKLRPSAITQPYLATFVTGFVRAVVSEIIASVPDHRRVLSITTDGFLTDAEFSEIDLAGPLASRFNANCQLLEPGKAMLVLKHRVTQAIPFKTRGCITVQAYNNEKIILAKAGVKPPCPPKEHNAWMLDIYKNRLPGQLIESSHLISLSEQWVKESDLINVKRQTRLNQEFDFKRRPINPRMIQVVDIELVAFDTVPWLSREQAEFARTIFDGWRETHCMKTLLDFEDWIDFYETHKGIRHSGLQWNGENSSGVLRRIFIRAFSRQVWGILSSMTYTELATWLTTLGYETTIDDVKNSKRAKLVEHVVPVTSHVIKLLKPLLIEFPQLELDKFFDSMHIEEVKAMLV
ncbi:MAG: DNA polymerase [Methylobacter sp.]|nr:DNA polymerase [Candidatus Methylobacter titanis]